MSTASAGPAPAAQSRAALPAFLGRFTVLREAPRELWIVLLVKLVGIAAYQVMNLTFVLWLSSDLGYSDQWAGFMVAGWSAVMTLFAVFAGSLADAIGLRKAILLGLAVTAASRAVMTFTTVKWLALAGGLLPLALGEALGGPVLAAGVRRYSTTAQRSISFALFYAMMNGGFIIADYIFDHVRQGLGEPHGHLALPWLRLDFTTYRALFLISLLIEVSLLPIAWFALRDGVEATDQGVAITPERPKHPGGSLWQAFGLMTRDALRETVRIFAGLWRQRGFYKFLAFLGLAAFVRLIFIQMYYTYPKFGIRELGEGAPVGRLFAINSVLILLLVPIVGALTQRISAYRMVSVGSAIAAASVFFMALPPRWFQPLADGWLGQGIANDWLGGDARFSPDDFPELPALAAKLQSASNPVSGALGQALSEPTRALLGRDLPEQAAGLGPHPSSALFAAADVSGAAALAARLRDDANAATRPVSAFVWSQFSPASLALLADANRPGPGRRAVLAQELNRILKGKTLYEARRFAGVALSPAALAFLDKHSNQAQAGTLRKAGGMPASRQDAGRMPAPRLPNQTLLMNRLLLEDTYTGELARSAHPLRVALAEDLGAIIRNGPLNELPGFPNLALTAQEKAQLAKKSQGTKLARLNRRLLEEAFPLEIARKGAGGSGSANPYYVMIFLFIALLSVGESIYSPRLYEYAAAIAPKGQEASYMSLSYLPFFLAKLPVAMFSGVLLARFCPETGPRNSAALWLIIALTTTIAPVGLLLLRRCIQVPEAGREPQTS
jgi:MFS family permease